MAFRHRRLLCKLKAVVDPFKKPDSDSDPLREPCDRPPVKQHHVATVLVLSIGLAAAALLLLSCLALRRYRSRRRSSSPWADTRSNREDFTDALREPPIDHPVWYIRTIGLPQSVVDSIEKLRYEKGEGLIETGDCAVCLSEFEEGESLRLLPKCSHAFHVACIDTWLRSHSNCPLCRAPIIGNRTSPAESSESEGSQVASESMIESRPAVLGVEDDRVINMIGQEMEAVSRSVSLDYFSAKNSFRTDRSTSFDIKITSSSNHETGSIGQSF